MQRELLEGENGVIPIVWPTVFPTKATASLSLARFALFSGTRIRILLPASPAESPEDGASKTAMALFSLILSLGDLKLTMKM